MTPLLFGIDTQKLSDLGVLHLKGLEEADSLDLNRLSSEEHLATVLELSKIADGTRQEVQRFTL